MSPDEQRLHAVICYAGSDAGDGMRRDLIAELARLRRVESAAKRIHEQSVSDGGYGQTLGFENALRELEAALFGPRSPHDQHTKKEHGT